MLTLYLCEKLIHAKILAKKLDLSEKSDGYFKGNDAFITWTYGHLFNLGVAEDYSKKTQQAQQAQKSGLSNLPIIPDPWLLKEKKVSQKHITIIKKLLKQVERVVIATPPDSYNDAAAWEVLENFYWDGEVKRLILMGFDDFSLDKALANLEDSSKSYTNYQYSQARTRVDWLISNNVSQLLKSKKSKVAVNYSKMTMLTGVLIKLVQQRDHLLYEDSAQLKKDLEIEFSQAGTLFVAQHAIALNDSSDWPSVSESLLARTFVLQHYNECSVSHPTPPLLTLSELQIQCHAHFGMNAHQVQLAAHALYETHQAILYPKSDPMLSALTPFIEIKAVIEKLKENETMSLLIAGLDDIVISATLQAALENQSVLLPTLQVPKIEQLSVDQKKVYELICRYFMAQFYGEALERLITYEVTIDDISFQGMITMNTDLGWRACVYPNMAIDSQSIDWEGQFVVTSSQIKKPPREMNSYTEITLLDAVNRLTDDKVKNIVGLGIEGNRSGLIYALVRNGFLHKNKRWLKVSPAGKMLLSKLPEELTEITFLLQWEQKFKQILTSEMEAEDVVWDAIEWCEDMVALIKAQKIEIKVVNRHQKVTEIIGDYICPECAKPLQRKKGNNGYFWGCSAFPSCETVLPDSGGRPGQKRVFNKPTQTGNKNKSSYKQRYR